MQIIVPLAGPDFDQVDGGTKAEASFGGRPLLRACLDERPWIRSNAAASLDFAFVLRDTTTSRRFAQEALESWYPGSKRIFLGDYANGAALSLLAGLSLMSAMRPVCVDLADIVYRSTSDPEEMFRSHSQLGGIGLTFRSSNPVYSYLREKDGKVVAAAEKIVISDRASAGTYLFRDPSVLLRAVSEALRNPERDTHGGRFFVCPLFNGVLASGLDVAACDVSDVVDVKQLDLI